MKNKDSLTEKEIESLIRIAERQSSKKWYLYLALSAGGFLLAYFYPQDSFASIALFLSGAILGIALEKIFSDRLRLAAIQLFRKDHK